MIQQTSDNNKELLPSEELLWHRILTKGIFRKKIIEGLVVTDHRVIKELPQSGHLFTLLLSHQSFQVPIDSSITIHNPTQLTESALNSCIVAAKASCSL